MNPRTAETLQKAEDLVKNTDTPSTMQRAQVYAIMGLASAVSEVAESLAVGLHNMGLKMSGRG